MPLRSAALRGAVVAAALLTGGCDTDSLADPTPSPGGPMREAPAHGSLVRGPVGTRITDGLDVLHLQGREDATVVSVCPVGGEGALAFLGAQLAGPQRRLAGWSQLEGYPPTHPGLGELVDAEGATLRPHAETRREMGYELLLGFEVVDDTEVAWRSAIEVVYRVGDTDYLWRSPSMLVYCPDGMNAQACFDQAGDPS